MLWDALKETGYTRPALARIFEAGTDYQPKQSFILGYSDKASDLSKERFRVAQVMKILY